MQAPRRGTFFSVDDEEIEPKKNLQQKEAISAQMIEVTQSRLDTLRTVGKLLQ
jgi:hypothetical protein